MANGAEYGLPRELLESAEERQEEGELDALRSRIDLTPPNRESDAEKLARLEKQSQVRRCDRQEARTKGLLRVVLGNDAAARPGLIDLAVVMHGRKGAPEDPAPGSALAKLKTLWDERGSERDAADRLALLDLYRHIRWALLVLGGFVVANAGAIAYVLMKVQELKGGH